MQLGSLMILLEYMIGLQHGTRDEVEGQGDLDWGISDMLAVVLDCNAARASLNGQIGGRQLASSGSSQIPGCLQSAT